MTWFHTESAWTPLYSRQEGTVSSEAQSLEFLGSPLLLASDHIVCCPSCHSSVTCMRARVWLYARVYVCADMHVQCVYAREV